MKFSCKLQEVVCFAQWYLPGGYATNLLFILEERIVRVENGREVEVR